MKPNFGNLWEMVSNDVCLVAKAVNRTGIQCEYSHREIVFNF